MRRVIITGMLLSFVCAAQAMEEEEKNKSKIYIGPKDEKILIKAKLDESGYHLIITEGPPFYKWGQVELYRWGKVKEKKFWEVSESVLEKCNIENKAQYLSGEKYYELTGKLHKKSEIPNGTLSKAISRIKGE